jgi:hypothetical protein
MGAFLCVSGARHSVSLALLPHRQLFQPGLALPAPLFENVGQWAQFDHADVLRKRNDLLICAHLA